MYFPKKTKFCWKCDWWVAPVRPVNQEDNRWDLKYKWKDSINNFADSLNKNIHITHSLIILIII